MKRWCIMALMTLGLFAGSLSAQTLSREEALQQLQPVVAELVALRAVNAMQLSLEQMQKLLPIAKRAQTEWSNYQERFRVVLQEQLDAFTKFRTEDLHNVGFTPQTERCTAQANHKGKELMKQLSDAVAALTQEAEAVLTPEQKAIAEQLHAAQLSVALRPPIQPLHRPKQQPTDDPIAQIRKELAAIYRAEYGEITPLGRFLLNPALVSVLERRLGMTPSPIPPLMDAELMKLERTVKTLRTDINTLNLINGLHMTQEQLMRLRELARKANESLPTEPQTVDAVAFQELMNILHAFRDRLANGHGLPPGLLLRAAQLARQAGLFGQRPNLPIALREIAAQVAALLSEEQKQVIADYKPCLIPPKNLKDPVRVGQAATNDAAIAGLRRLRAIPSALYQRRKDTIVERLAQQIELRGGQYPAEERDAFKQKLMALIERMRALSDADFELQAEELADEFRRLARKVVLEEKLKELTASSAETQLLDKIAANLLHPRVEVVIAERLQVLANAKPGDGKGLQTLPVANDGGICPKPEK